MPEFKTPFAEFQQVQQVTAEQDPATATRTAADLAKAQREEWGKYVAADRIYSASGALAFLPGHAVPQSSVSDDGPVYPNQVAVRPSWQEAVEAGPAAPAGNASTEEWRVYAVEHGVPEAEAAEMGREDIKARLGV